MKKIKLSELITKDENIVVDAKKQSDGTFLVKLTDNDWYILEKDYVQLSEKLTGLIARINALADEK